MTKKNRAYFKGTWNSNYRLKESDYDDLFDSCFMLEDDTSAPVSADPIGTASTLVTQHETNFPHITLSEAISASPVKSVNSQTGNVVITRNDIGLGNIDNTSDLNKPISTLTSNALNLKANLASPFFTGSVSGITKDMVGLNNVDNTSDLNKPISNLTSIALSGKEPSLGNPSSNGMILASTVSGGRYWTTAASGAVGTGITASSTPPSNPTVDTLWLDSNDYNATSTSVTVTDTPSEPLNPSLGDLWIDPNLQQNNTVSPLTLQNANYVKVSRSTTQSILTATSTVVQINSIDFSSNSSWTLNGSYQVVIPTGISNICCIASATFSSSTIGNRAIQIYKNGVSVGEYTGLPNVNSWGTTFNVQCITQVVAGDVIHVIVYQDSGSTLNITKCELSIFTLSTSQVLIGGNSGSLLAEQTLNSDVSAINFTGLNSLLDGDYTLEYSIKNPLGVPVYPRIYFNGNTTPTNYRTFNAYWNYNTSSISEATGSNNSAGINLGANGTSFSVCKIKCNNGIITASFDGVEYTNDTSIFRALLTVKFSASSITSISLVCDSSTIGLGVGSNFKLYGSKTPTQLVSYNPYNFANLTGDRLLRAGEIAYIDYTLATSVPLNIATEEGLYELIVIGNKTIASASGRALFKPNNANQDTYIACHYTSVTNVMSYYDGFITGGFWLSEFRTDYSRLLISTFTNNKTVEINSQGYNGTFVAMVQGQARWVDYTTPWISLGTLTLVSSQSGKIVVRRII